MRFPLLFLLASLWVSSCQAQGIGGQKEVATSPEVVSTDAHTGVGVTTFEKYEELAPIFEQKNDTTYLINFWATWCKPCVEELPFIEQLHDDFAGQKLKIILVSLDFPDQIDSKLIPFIKDRQLRSQVMVLLDGDYNAWIDRVEPAWGGAIPVTIIYNAEKRVFIDRPVKKYDDLKTAVASFF
ncbi:MAG: TlpA family protein disulfide reductase [Saprospirales bacterium]|nr:TlpA family protein disulfide reductase [Saprospirales bacterium]MBK8490798.1 TlpA family protein disulfide reductase [Saprospirales bacterium]